MGQDDEAKKKAYDVSFNRHRATRLQGKPPGGPMPQTLMAITALRKRLDDYFDNTVYPTISGLVMAAGFDSVQAYSEGLELLSKQIAATGDPAKVTLKTVLEKARTKIILHYEEGLQSGTIPVPAAKYVMESLGIQPPKQVDPSTAGSTLAADAVRAANSKRVDQAQKAGKVAKRRVG